MTKAKCAGSIYEPRVGFHPCYHHGKVEEDGKFWCRIHLPSRAKARRDKQSDKMHWNIVGEGLRDEVSFQGRCVTTVARDVVNKVLPFEKLEKAVRELEAAEKKLDTHRSSDSCK